MEVQTLVAEHFQTISDVDVLLLVHGDQDRRWCPSRVAEELRIHPDQATGILARMSASGLLRQDDGGYAYGPRTPQLAGAVATMAALHPTYRLAIISLIFSPQKNRRSENLLGNS